MVQSAYMGVNGGAAQGVKVPVLCLDADYEKWKEFISSQHIVSQPVISYYFPSLCQSGGSVSARDVLRVASQLFRDFCELGALTLPSSCASSDWQLRLGGKFDGGNVCTRCVLSLENLGNGRKAEVKEF